MIGFSELASSFHFSMPTSTLHILENKTNISFTTFVKMLPG